MLGSEAYAFIDIDNPLCAWAAYRGALVCPPNIPGFMSVWAAGLLRDGQVGRISREIALEAVRAKHYPQHVSRLRGMFCLPDHESATRACSWDRRKRTHFQSQYLAELSLAEAGTRRDKLDANWITRAEADANDRLAGSGWMEKYWAGEPYPDEEPIWEMIVDGRLIVLDMDLRQRAYAAVRSEFPDSLMFLEISRLAAWIGSNLGAISTFHEIKGNEIAVSYAMNMEDAGDPTFLDKLAYLAKTGHPINWADIDDHFVRGSFGRVPDLKPYGFCREFCLVSENAHAVDEF